MDTPKRDITTIDQYIESFPAEVKDKLNVIRQIIRDVAPEAQEKISYKMPAFTLHGVLVYFAAWKKHIAMYPISTEMEATIKDLSNYTTSGKGTVQFPLNKPLPVSLVRDIVAFRVRENLEKAQKT
jgi:uncharacterized protein YdhG (YjbR/CyaY superfamily)